VGVDPDADAELLVVRDGAHSHLPFCEAMAITGRRAGQSCDGALSQPPIRSLPVRLVMPEHCS